MSTEPEVWVWGADRDPSRDWLPLPEVGGNPRFMERLQSAWGHVHFRPVEDGTFAPQTEWAQRIADALPHYCRPRKGLFLGFRTRWSEIPLDRFAGLVLSCAAAVHSAGFRGLRAYWSATPEEREASKALLLLADVSPQEEFAQLGATIANLTRHLHEQEAAVIERALALLDERGQPEEAVELLRQAKQEVHEAEQALNALTEGEYERQREAEQKSARAAYQPS